MMKFTILLDPFLVIITNLRVCLIYAQEWRRRFKKKQHQFFTFYCKIISNWFGGGGVIKFPVSDFPTPQNVTYQTYNVMHNA